MEHTILLLILRWLSLVAEVEASLQSSGQTTMATTTSTDSLAASNNHLYTFSCYHHALHQLHCINCIASIALHQLHQTFFTPTFNRCFLWTWEHAQPRIRWCDSLQGPSEDWGRLWMSIKINVKIVKETLGALFCQCPVADDLSWWTNSQDAQVHQETSAVQAQGVLKCLCDRIRGESFQSLGRLDRLDHIYFILFPSTACATDRTGKLISGKASR